MIQAKNLTHYYDGFLAVDSLSINVRKGELFGLIGPNGAGKTTVIKILCCLLKPTSGVVLIDGLNVLDDEIEVKKRIGYLTEGNNLYEEMTIRQYLEFFSEIYSLRKDKAEDRIHQYLKMLEISDRINSKIGTLSKGMQRKVGISRALINNPKVIIFDEPTTGLDPVTARFIRDFMRKLTGEGRTVLMSTHYLHEAEVLCDRVAIIDKGRLITSGRVDELKREFNGKDLEDVFMNALSSKDETQNR